MAFTATKAPTPSATVTSRHRLASSSRGRARKMARSSRGKRSALILRGWPLAACIACMPLSAMEARFDLVVEGCGTEGRSIAAEGEELELSASADGLLTALLTPSKLLECIEPCLADIGAGGREILVRLRGGAGLQAQDLFELRLRIEPADPGWPSDLPARFSRPPSGAASLPSASSAHVLDYDLDFGGPVAGRYGFSVARAGRVDRFELILEDAPMTLTPSEKGVPSHIWETVPTFVPGDVDADGAIHWRDSHFLLDHLFAGGAAPSCLQAADIDGDGVLDILDAIELVESILTPGAGPRTVPMAEGRYDDRACGNTLDPASPLTCFEFTSCPAALQFTFPDGPIQPEPVAQGGAPAVTSGGDEAASVDRRAVEDAPRHVLAGGGKPETAALRTVSPAPVESLPLEPARVVAVTSDDDRVIRHAGAELRVRKDAVMSGSPISIGISPLPSGDLPPLDPGMINVTQGPRRGYRFTPHGAKFLKPLEVVLPYDPGLLPSGFGADAVQTYYFDEDLRRWAPLERVKIDPASRIVVSLSDHFTDMINATVVVPEHPENISFNPTELKDLKAADPGAGIQLIEAPRGNNSGDARLGLDIEVPEGRSGLHPELAVRYNSSGQNGWLGLGWDLSVPAVAIDTRWGVPRYAPDKETETYLLNGRQLTPVAHRGPLRDRQAERTFHARVEGEFLRILRHGDAPDVYWWEVTDKMGVRYFYGGDPDAGRAPDAVLADPSNPARANIFKWCLRRVLDPNGNHMTFEYDVVEGGGAGAEPWRQIYLRRIRYTGREADPGSYEVAFEREDGRPDPIVDGRPGFKTVLDQRLAGIEVRFLADANPLIRRYEFRYRIGRFAKSLLESVAQFGEDGSPFHSHSFDYFDEVDAGDPTALRGFAAPIAIVQGTTRGGDLLVAGETSTALGAEQRATNQGHLYVGVGSCGKEVSGGGKVGFDDSDSERALALIDIDGDGLPDQVFLEGDDVLYRRQIGGPGTEPAFGPPREIPGLAGLGTDGSNTVTAGPQVFLGASFMADFSRTWTRGRAYFTDVNGDLLPDFVANGAVSFNRLVDGSPEFRPDSPTPLEPGAGADASGMVPDDPAERAELEEKFYLVDPLIRWRAPYSGVVAIGGTVRLAGAPAPDYRTADGVRVSIQLNDRELWSARIEETDLSPRSIDGLGSVPVARGDDLYFRVNSIDDGSFDAVEVLPTVTYQGVPDPGLVDENGMPAHRFDPGADFSFGGLPLTLAGPFTGSARITGTIRKLSPTTDDVRVLVTKNGVILRTVEIPRTGTGDTIVEVPIDTVLDASDPRHPSRDLVGFLLDADSRIDWTKIVFADPPRMTYVSVEGVSDILSPDGTPLFAFDLPATETIYPISPSTAPLRPWAAPRKGRIRITHGVSMAVPGQPPDFSTDINLTVKRPVERLAKTTVRVRAGIVLPPSSLVAEFDVEAGDLFYFDAAARHPDTLMHVVVGRPEIEYIDVDPPERSVADREVHLALPLDSPMGGGFRNWSHGQYNGNDSPAPIDEGLIRLPRSEDDKIHERYSPMVPFIREGHWRAYDELCWNGPGGMSSTRLQVRVIDPPTGAGLGGARGVTRLGGGSTRAGDISLFGFGAGCSDGDSWTDVDFLDLNGDNYPDVVGGGQVQSTLPNGALADDRHPFPGTRVRQSTNRDGNISLGATTSRTSTNARGEVEGQMTEMGNYNPIGSFSANAGMGLSVRDSDLIDINGDSLPDRVYRSGEVQLNLGYRFGALETWPGLELGQVYTSNRRIQAGAGVAGGTGGTTPAYSFGGGLAYAESRGETAIALQDINGDGLVDVVSKEVGCPLPDFPTPCGDITADACGAPGSRIQVRINTGAGFLPAVEYLGDLPEPIEKTRTVSGNLGLHFTITICIFGYGININPGFNHGDSLSTPVVELRDFDGDGYPDRVASDADGTLRMAANLHGKTNLLRTILRPLGSRISLDYARSGNTPEQPQNRWVLASVVTHDGFPDDGVDYLVSTFEYSGGRHDRAEREFLGFRTVLEEQRDAAGAGDVTALDPRTLPVDRRRVRTYRNDDVYVQGLLEAEVVEDGAGRKFTETIHDHRPIAVADGAGVPGLEEFTETRFPRLVRTDERFYEGQPAAGKATSVSFAYDDLGNVVEHFDEGDDGPEDDVRARIEYFSDPARHIVGKPRRIVVSGNGAVMRRREATIEPGTGNLLQLREYLENGDGAVTDLSYRADGNLLSLLGPSNHRGQRYRLAFEYDPITASHVTRTTDSFGYQSTMEPNYKHDKPRLKVDINGQRTSYEYDVFGRLTALTGPHETAGGVPTVRMEYHPEASVPWASTRHLDAFRDPGDPIETVTFIDGLNRVLQTKKDATVHLGPDAAVADVMVASGRVLFDHVGRTVRQFYPTTEPLGRADIFNPTFDAVPPTATDYDVLDRTTRITTPEGRVTQFRHGFAPDRAGVGRFATWTTDPNGNRKVLYADVRNLTTAIQEFNPAGGQVVWTSYRYDALRQLREAVDDRGNATALAYDNFGRQTAIDSPDAGETTFEYDLAGNLRRRVTANLVQEGKAIVYEYEFKRLQKIVYPNFPGNNVTYEYGGPGAPGNTAGRVKRFTDQAGAVERSYGPLGEVVREVRTVSSFLSGPTPAVYSTAFTYDTWNRVQEMVYPDGEVVTYGYDSGGLLRAVSGIKAQVRIDYVRRLEYDKFDQRAFQEAANGVRTRYAYDPLDRRLSRLTAAPDGSAAFLDMKYAYDDVGNVLELTNDVFIPPAGSFGGPTHQRYVYDDLYRLVGSTGTFSHAPGKLDRYSLSQEYDTIDNIVSKRQQHEVVEPGGQVIPKKKTTYDFSYVYGGTRPHAPTHIGEQTYSYDACGNGLGWTHDKNGTRRNIVWDDENRIQSISDNGQSNRYKYDHEGQRVIKRGPQGETVYVNQYFSVRNRSIATKHIYAGETRVASKLSPGVDAGQTAGKLAVFAGSSVSLAAGKTLVGTPEANFTYYFSPDHLGSSIFVTDSDGKPFQHLRYFPSGETWVEEKSNTQRTPYLFTAKELDEETALYYHGARYYDPRTSVWQSTDPILGKLLRKYEPRELNLYGYAMQNPVRYTDPTGRESKKELIEIQKEIIRLSQDPKTRTQALNMIVDKLLTRPKALKEIVYNPNYSGPPDTGIPRDPKTGEMISGKARGGVGDVKEGALQAITIGPSFFEGISARNISQRVRTIRHELEHVKQRSQAQPIKSSPTREFLATYVQLTEEIPGIKQLSKENTKNRVQATEEWWTQMPEADRKQYEKQHAHLKKLQEWADSSEDKPRP